MFKLENIISFLISPPMIEGLSIVKIVFSLFSLFFIGGTIYFIVRSSWLKNILIQDLVEILTYRSYWKIDAARNWKKIEKHLTTGSESEYKLAVIEADSILNKTLRMMGYTGESLGERLEKVSDETIPYLDQLWEAHKIRNNVIHDPDYKLSLGEAKGALDTFKRALRDLEAF